MLRKCIWAVLIILILFLVSSPLISLIRQEPVLAVTIRTWSMEPALTRGDMVLIWPSWASNNYTIGQMVVFKSEENGIRDWVLHRIVGGNAEEGFITQGDANGINDQAENNFPPIQPEWIAGSVPVISSVPLKIPLLGYLPLLLEENIGNPKMLPVFLGVLAVALVLDEVFKSKKQRKKESLQKSQLYFLGGLAFAVLMGSVMLMSSLFITFPYGVEDQPGVLMGSDVGIMKQGTTKEIKVAELKNEGMIPSFYYVVSNDPQIILEQNEIYLPAMSEATVSVTIHALDAGIHQGKVTVGMFLPFLPRAVIQFLAEINFWLALIVLSLIPAVPLFILPYLEPRYRRRAIRSWRKRLAKITSFGL